MKVLKCWCVTHLWMVFRDLLHLIMNNQNVRSPSFFQQLLATQLPSHRQQLVIRATNYPLSLYLFVSCIDWFVMYAAPKSEWCAKFGTGPPRNDCLNMRWSPVYFKTSQFSRFCLVTLERSQTDPTSRLQGIKTFLLIMRSIIKIYSFSINSVVYSI